MRTGRFGVPRALFAIGMLITTAAVMGMSGFWGGLLFLGIALIFWAGIEAVGRIDGM